MRAHLALLFVLVMVQEGQATTISHSYTVTPNDGHIYSPIDTALVSSSRLAVLYSSGTFDGTQSIVDGIYLRVVDANSGTLSSSTQILSSNNFARIAATSANNGRLAYLERMGGNNVLFLKRFDIDGNLTFPVQVTDDSVNVSTMDVAVADDGTTLVTWFETGTTGRSFRTYARRYDANLFPLGFEFILSDDLDFDDPDRIVAAFPTIDCDGSSFAVAFNDLTANGVGNSKLEVIVVSLRHDGGVRWKTRLRPGVRREFLVMPQVALLTNGLTYVAHRVVNSDHPEDDELVFAQILEANGISGDPFRISLPLRGFKAVPRLAVHQGVYVGVANGNANNSPASTGHGHNEDSLDIANFDFAGAPISADPPLVDNEIDGSPSVVGEHVTPIAGNHLFLVVAYAAHRLNDNTAAGTAVNLLFMPAGPPTCPSTTGCGTLHPFSITGEAAHRLNVVLRPTEYYERKADGTPATIGGVDGRVAFLRDARDAIVSGIRYGSVEHATRYDHLNFLIDFAPSDIPHEDSNLGCAYGISFQEIDRYNRDYPWIRAVGSQLNPGTYTTDALASHPPVYPDSLTPGPPYAFCSHLQVLSNGGSVFYYPSYVTGVFEHELSHSLYGLPDEYAKAEYFEDDYPGPPNTQSVWKTLQDCQTEAVTSGWLPSDCHLLCDPATGITDCPMRQDSCRS